MSVDNAQKYIDTSKVISIAQDFTNINNRYKDDFSSVENAIGKLKSEWQQPQKVASAAFACFDEIKSKYFEPSIQDREQLAQYLCDAVGIGYEEVENTNKKILEGLFNTVEAVIPMIDTTVQSNVSNAIASDNILWDTVKEEIADFPEDINSAGEALAWLEEQYEKGHDRLPDWLSHGADVVLDIFVPSSLQTAYTLTSEILQGDLTLKDTWDAVTSVLKKNTKLAVICETINYTLDKGNARYDKMKQEITEQISEGDVLGAVFDGAEGFIDTIIGGSIEILGDVVGGLVDKIIDDVPIVKGINKLVEYGTGLLGWNDGDGYSVGGLISAGTEIVSDVLDMATDFITDKIDVVTDAVTDGVKAGISWVKSWFD